MDARKFSFFLSFALFKGTFDYLPLYGAKRTHLGAINIYGETKEK